MKYICQRKLCLNIYLSSDVPCDWGSSETPAHEREVVRHRYEDKRLCILDDLMDGVYISGAISSAEEFRRALQEPKAQI